MLNHRFVRMSMVCAALFVIVLVGCVVIDPGGDGGPSVSFTVGGKTVTLRLGPAGVFTLSVGKPVTNIADANNFLGGAPTDNPTTGMVRLRSSNVTLRSSVNGKTSATTQQVSGNVRLRWTIDRAGAVDPCATGIVIGTFVINITEDGVISVVNEELSLTPEAVALFLQGEISMCFRMEADLTAVIEIGDIDIIFGQSDDASGGNDNGNGNDNGADATCGSDSDCLSDETCVVGRCELQPSQPGACASNGDCGFGEVCVASECVPAPDCSTDTDCSTGESCVGGECVPAPSGCVLDTDCPTGETCTNGECVPAAPECVVDADCSTGEICTAGECVSAPPECVLDTDCATGETCTVGECVPASEPEFTLAVIDHVGSEQIIVGPKADVASGFVPESGYGVTHMALSGNGQNMWFITRNEFAEDPADVQRLYFIQADGTDLERSSVPLSSVTDGFAIPVMFSLATGDDGLRAVVEARRNIPFTETASIFYDVILPGFPATAVFDTLGFSPMPPFGDRRRMQMSDDSNFVSWSDGVSIWRYPMNILNSVADNEFTVSGFACGNFAGDSIGSFDRTTVDVRTLFGIRAVEGSEVCNTIILGSSQTDSAVQNLTQNDFVIESVHISDDGLLMAYCLFSGIGSQAGPAPCFVQGVNGPAAGFALTQTSDTWDRFTDIVLADSGNRYRVVVSPNVFGPNGISVFETLGLDDRLTTGTDVFGGNSQSVNTVQLSFDGTVMAGLATTLSQKANIYVLHDGNASLPGFPSIESVSYRYDAEADAFVFRVQVTSDNGLNLVKVYPMKNGVDPGEYLLTEENPFFDIRFGFGGVTVAVEGTTDIYEQTVPLFGLGDLIDASYVLRVLAIDGTGARTVFADIPAPQVVP